MAYPNQYTRQHSTIRRICAAIDENGPMTLDELMGELNMTYTGLKTRANQAVADGYLAVTKVKLTVRQGRPANRYSRTELELPPREAESVKNQRRRMLREQEKARVEAARTLTARRDPLVAAFFGAAA